MAESEGERSACEGRGGEVSARASGTEMPEGTNEENETQAIAKKTDGRCAECDACRRELRAEAERKNSVHDACEESFPHCNLRWITTGNLSGEIIVDAPADTGSADQH